jgi:ribonuclease BN (tRNA processing enzyme)
MRWDHHLMIEKTRFFGVMIAEGIDRTVSKEPITARRYLTPREAGAVAREAEVRVLILSHLWVEDDRLSGVQEGKLVFGGRVVLATAEFCLN